MSLFNLKSDKVSHEAHASLLLSLQSSGLFPRHFFALTLGDYDSAPAAKNNVLAVLLAVFVLLVSITSFELWHYTPSIADENGLLEIIQDVFLFAAFATALVRYRLIRFSGSLNAYIFLGLALFTLMFFLRELDINKLGSSALWPLAEKLLRTLASVALLAFAVSVLKNSKLLLHNIANILAAPAVILAIIACSLYILSWPFDKKVFAIDYALSQLIEELIELTAGLLFALAAFSYGVKQSNPSRHSDNLNHLS